MPPPLCAALIAEASDLGAPPQKRRGRKPKAKAEGEPADAPTGGKGKGKGRKNANAKGKAKPRSSSSRPSPKAKAKASPKAKAKARASREKGPGKAKAKAKAKSAKRVMTDEEKKLKSKRTLHGTKPAEQQGRRVAPWRMQEWQLMRFHGKIECHAWSCMICLVRVYSGCPMNGMHTYADVITDFLSCA